MTAPRWKDRVGATPGKLAVALLLFIAFVYVCWGSTAEQTVKTEARRPKKSTSATVPKATTKQPEKPATDREKDWPTFSAKEAGETDPFAKPGWYLTTTDGPAATTRGPRQTLEELRKTEPKIIVVAGDKRVATIGSEEFREGDIIDGLMISEITSEGILFTEIHQ